MGSVFSGCVREIEGYKIFNRLRLWEDRICVLYIRAGYAIHGYAGRLWHGAGSSRNLE